MHFFLPLDIDAMYPTIFALSLIRGFLVQVEINIRLLKKISRKTSFSQVCKFPVLSILVTKS